MMNRGVRTEAPTVRDLTTPIRFCAVTVDPKKVS